MLKSTLVFTWSLVNFIYICEKIPVDGEAFGRAIALKMEYSYLKGPKLPLQYHFKKWGLFQCEMFA